MENAGAVGRTRATRGISATTTKNGACRCTTTAKDEKTQAFVTAYEETYGDTPNQFAADAYDVVYAIYQAVLAGNINGDMDASDICEALKTQFSSMTFDGLTGDGMTWDASGAVSKAPKAVVIKDGAYAAM